MTRFYCHKSTGVLTTAIGGGSTIQRLTMKRARVTEFEVVFHDGAARVVHPNGTEGAFIVKAKGDPTSAAVVLDTSWEDPATDDGGYIFSVIPQGTALDTALAAGNQFDSEIVWDLDDGRHGTPTFGAVINQNVYRGDEPAISDPDAEFPLPGDILRVSNSLSEIASAGASAQSAARQHLGILTGSLTRLVTYPTSGTTAGIPGDFSHNAAYLAIYIGDGTTHSWLEIAAALKV